jgi:subtilisin family serine protease
VISPAGNVHVDIGSTPTPIASMVVVTSVDSDDVLADFASYGAGVDVSAPGVDLYGVYPVESGTGIWSGTSFSTALVAGAFALVQELHPTWNDASVVSRILTTSDAIDSLNSSALAGKLGAGRLNLDALTDD